MIPTVTTKAQRECGSFFVRHFILRERVNKRVEKRLKPD